MEVRKIETSDGTVTAIEFAYDGTEDFKAQIKVWVKKNYPTMTFEQLFSKLVEFRANGICRISMS